MTETELLAQALAEMRKASISVDEWVRRTRDPGFRWRTSHIGKALLALDKLRAGGIPPQPHPQPPALTLQRTIFWAQVDDDAVQYATRLKGWRHALTADPAYAPTLSQVNALKATSAGVDAWGNQEQIPFTTISQFYLDWGLEYVILQAETVEEFASASAWPRVIGNPNAWLPEQRRVAQNQITTGRLAVTAEVYDGRPDTYSSQGVPVSSFTLGVALDAGLHYPLADLIAKTPAAARSSVCIWHGTPVLLDDADRAALMTL